MTMPQRIQRKRTKGWRMPDGAVYVGRPTRFANPVRVGSPITYQIGGGFPIEREVTPAVAVALFRDIMRRRTAKPGSDATAADIEFWRADLWGLSELWGRDLACWCPLDQPCHADVLLELANGRG